MVRDIAERIELLERELRDVDLQEAAGELDSATADRLRRTYRTEQDELRHQPPLEEEDPATRSPQRLLVGALLLTGAFIVIVIAAVNALSSDAEPAPLGTDLSQVSNEAMLQVIEANADNPQVNAMRLALAERYFEELDYSAALPQFQAVLDNQPSPGEASEALARMGWMVHASGASDVAESLISRSLEARQSNTEAQWFLSIVYIDTERPCDAAELLSALLTDPLLPSNVVADVEALATRADTECSP